MRKIIVAEFMTLDGVIQNEEIDGDGFKYDGPGAVSEPGAIATGFLEPSQYQKR